MSDRITSEDLRRYFQKYSTTKNKIFIESPLDETLGNNISAYFNNRNASIDFCKECIEFYIDGAPGVGNLGKIYPFEVFLSKGSGGLPKDSKVKADQIRTLDKARLAKLLGKVDQKQVAAIDKAIAIHLGLE